MEIRHIVSKIKKPFFYSGRSFGYLCRGWRFYLAGRIKVENT